MCGGAEEEERRRIKIISLMRTAEIDVRQPLVRASRRRWGGSALALWKAVAGRASGTAFRFVSTSSLPSRPVLSPSLPSFLPLLAPIACQSRCFLAIGYPPMRSRSCPSLSWFIVRCPRLSPCSHRSRLASNVCCSQRPSCSGFSGVYTDRKKALCGCCNSE